MSVLHSRRKHRRIQRKRSKGWRMPTNAVYVGRPTIFGNPFDTADEYRRWIIGEPTGYSVVRARDVIARLSDLRGKTLACWCPLDKPCHADVLIEYLDKMNPKPLAATPERVK